MFTEYLKNYKHFTVDPIQLRHYFLVKKWQTRQRTFCNPKWTACLFIRLPPFCSKMEGHITHTNNIGISLLRFNFLCVTSIQGSRSFQIDFLKVFAFQQTRRSTFGNVKKRLVEAKEVTHVRCYQEIRAGKNGLIYHVTFKISPLPKPRVCRERNNSSCSKSSCRVKKYTQYFPV